MAVAVLLTVDDFLAHAGLHFLVHVRIGETDEQAIGPRFVDKTGLGHDGLVVVSVVETLHVLELGAVVRAGLEVLDRRINPVVVVGIVLESVYLILETVGQGLTEVHV